MQKGLVSIIIRTKNESFWIGQCLNAIDKQIYKNYEIILVDNNSKDNTLSIIKKNFKKIKIVNYKSKSFKPGKALNLGISKSKGEYIAIISGHCIPKNKYWLSFLIKNIKKKNIAGCYGKQEPLDISNAHEVRDMYYLFGDDKKTQTKDPFFHNANSIIKKKIWKKNKFDEKINHIEDRLWAEEVLKKKFKIIYEPNASVFHYHGVGHSQNLLRVSRIAKIISKKKITKKLYFCALTTINKPFKTNDNKYLVDEAIKELIKIKKINKIFIVTDDKKFREYYKNKKIIFLNRPNSFSDKILGPDHIIKNVYPDISEKYNPSHFLCFEENYPYRPKNFFSKLINNFDENYDSLVPFAKYQDHNIWKKTNSKMEMIYKTTLPSSMLKYSVFREIKGLGCIVKSSNIEANGRESRDTKFIEVADKYAFKFNSKLIEVLKKYQ